MSKQDKQDQNNQDTNNITDNIISNINEHKQLQLQLQALINMQQGKGAANKDFTTGASGGLSGKNIPFYKLNFKNMNFKIMVVKIFNSILQKMHNNIRFIDQFIRFVIGRNQGINNEVMQDARPPIIFGVYIILFFVLIGGVWAGLAPLDSAAVASGTVISNTKKKDINHQEGGIIKKIYLKVGDEVKAGDNLLEFDDTKIRSDYQSVLNQYRTLLANESRLSAEINNDEMITYPEFLINNKALPEVAKIIDTQNNLFQAKKYLQKAEKDSLKQRILQQYKQIEGLKAKKNAIQKNLAVIQDHLDSSRKLHARGFVQKTVLLELEAKEANAVSEIAMTESEITRTEQEITKTEIDLLNIDNKIVTQALNDLKDVQVAMSERREKFHALSDSLERVIIKSPVDGIVNHINYHTINSYIPPSQPILEISPTADKLVIEAKIEPKNIDSIRVGLISKIRFSAFKSRTTPLFTGRVVSLSPDIVFDNRQQIDPRYAGGYYLARIELDMEEFDKMAGPRKLELHPGMQAEVQIVTGTRTLLKYLLDPVFDAMFRGFKEK